MKKYLIIPALLFCALVIGQAQENYSIKIFSKPKAPKYLQEAELEAYLFNNTSESIKITDPKFSEPAWYLFKADWIIFDEKGKRLNSLPFLDNATGKFSSKNIVTIKPGDSLQIATTFFVFKDAGVYNVIYTFDHNPRYSSLYEKSEDARNLSVVKAKNRPLKFSIEKSGFEDFEQGELPANKDLGAYKTYSNIQDAFTEPQKVFRLNVGNITQEDFNDVCRLKNLRQLFLSIAELDSIPAAFSELKLCELSIKINKYTGNGSLIIPEGLCDMQELERLELSGNFSIILPDSISKLNSLTSFSTYEMDYEVLPENFGRLEKLRYISISDNSTLRKLPESFSELKRLYNFSFSDCDSLSNLPVINSAINSMSISCSLKITKIPNCPKAINSLEYISIGNASIAEIPTDISKYKKLSQIYLIGNELTALPPELLNVEKLLVLNVLSNNIPKSDKTLKALKNKLDERNFAYDK